MPLTHGKAKLEPGKTFLLRMRFKVAEDKTINLDNFIPELCQLIGLPVEVVRFHLEQD